MVVRDLHEVLLIHDVEAGHQLHVEHGDHLLVHLADQARHRGRLESPPENVGRRHELTPQQGLQFLEPWQVGELGKPDPERPADQVLVHHPAVLSLFRVGHDVLHVHGDEAGHRAAHGEGRRRDHVLPREALHDVKVERDAVVEEALRRGHVEHHDLQHAEAEGAVKGVAPALKVLDKRGEHLEWGDPLPRLVEVHKVCHLRLRVPAGHAVRRNRVDGGNVGPVVVQEGPHVQAPAQVNVPLLEGFHDLVGFADVPEEDHVRNVVLAQIDRGRHAGLLIEVDTYHHERMLGEHLSPRHVRLDVLVYFHEQVAAARPRVHDGGRLRPVVLPGKDDVDVAHEVLEQGLVLSSAADHVQRPLAMDLRLHRVLAGVDEAPAGILEQDRVEL
mmetsp:Transcript_10772/g.28806  ORF Transcript_10772/g.28806 Transcript_10772/m.28806 type:complete len:387 (+) Transcript_10772:1135-2295(+)